MERISAEIVEALNAHEIAQVLPGSFQVTDWTDEVNNTEEDEP